MNEPPFWLVWCEDGDQPTRKHKTQERAQVEANRLANAMPGRAFCVLPCVTRIAVQRTTFEQFEVDTCIPF